MTDEKEYTEMPNTWSNRSLCDVLGEMRKCHKTRNYAYLLGLIEEAQSMGNKMEAGLEDLKDLKKLVEARSKVKAEVKKLISIRKNLIEQNRNQK